MKAHVRWREPTATNLVISFSNFTPHTCPEALIQLSELIKRSVNKYLLQFMYILRDCKDLNIRQKEKTVISLLLNFGGEKWGFSLFLGLDWSEIG